MSRWNWEFWPWYIFYAPLFPYLIIQIFRHRSYRFFYDANPGMYRGGLVGERKSEILNLVPSSWIPPWILVPYSASPQDVLQQLVEHNLSFPLIGKPDIGERGEGIRLLLDIESWKLYHQNQSQNYLLQTYCDMPVEAGIFYARLPGSPKGKVISLCTKEMMKVTGDGQHTVEDLLMLNERNHKHLDRLRESSGTLLRSIPEKEQVLLVEPIGNHCRGTIFLDSSAWITPELEQSMDTLCMQISGFYYGRLDVKAPSELALKEGKGLQILEVNGISSEPGHIYQPGFSLWQAWRDVLTCWRWMVVIAEKNHK